MSGSNFLNWIDSNPEALPLEILGMIFAVNFWVCINLDVWCYSKSHWVLFGLKFIIKFVALTFFI